MSPEEQSRLTVETGTLSGIPAASAAARERYKGEGGWQVPSQFAPRHMSTSDLMKGGAHIRTYANIINRRRIQFSFLQSSLRVYV
jgi:hypothetical protein